MFLEAKGGRGWEGSGEKKEDWGDLVRKWSHIWSGQGVYRIASS